MIYKTITNVLHFYHNMDNSTAKNQLIEKLAALNDDVSLKDIKKTVAEFYIAHSADPDQRVWKSPIGRRVFIGSMILAVISLFLIVSFPKCTYLALGLYAGWTILPPCWFLYEYVWIFPDYLKFDSDQFGDLKYTHETVGKIWAGLVVVMTAYLLVIGGNTIKA